MHVRRMPLVCAALLTILAGCGPADEDGEEQEGSLGITEQEVSSDNALVPNAITPNAITPNALDPAALGSAALSVPTLSASSFAAIRDPGSAGELSRMFLKYVVSCALSAAQSFAFSWTDSKGVVHNEVYPGDLGFAPAWATQPLDVTGQEWVTACIAARTNWYGVSVLISMRSLMVSTRASDAEIAAYPYEEGAFWGNLFAATPILRSCYWTTNIAHSRAAYRDCAAGHLNNQGSVVECGALHIVGACNTYCNASQSPDGRHPYCIVDPSVSMTNKTDHVMTVFLP